MYSFYYSIDEAKYLDTKKRIFKKQVCFCNRTIWNWKYNMVQHMYLTKKSIGVQSKHSNKGFGDL